MPWDEFTSLLSGIMPNTPLGQVVSIRSEEDKEKLKHFNKEQHGIRNKWRNRHAKEMTENEKIQAIKEVQNIFAKAFG